jgi:hypothetical protein
MVRWLLPQGLLPLSTPLGGSWLQMAQSVQRIIVRRALSGQHPNTVGEIITWLEETVVGWNSSRPLVSGEANVTNDANERGFVVWAGREPRSSMAPPLWFDPLTHIRGRDGHA